jgi:hypothetical protein
MSGAFDYHKRKTNSLDYTPRIIEGLIINGLRGVETLNNPLFPK